MSSRRNELLQRWFEGTISRRDFVKRAALAGVSVSAIGVLLKSPVLAQDATVIQWWDHFAPLQELHQQLWDTYIAEHPDVQVDYTLLNPAEAAQALQLSFRSGQAPDVMPNLTGAPVSQLIEQNWFVPLAQQEFFKGKFEGALFEGITVFNGEVYSFPLFSPRQHQTSNWFNKQLIEAAGFDPEVGPKTWDEVREAAKTINEQGGGQVYGLLLPLQFTDRMAAHVTDLASVAGAPGAIDWTTGEYAYASEPFVRAIEFLLSFQQDGTLHPASSSLDARQGRARWAAGEAGMFTDGPWNIGVIKSNFPEIMDSIGVAPLPVPEAGVQAFVHSAPPSGVFWISSQAERPEVASDILQLFTADDYYVGLAERMDQPPFDLSAVEKAEVHPTYKKVIQSFADTVRLAPDPIVRNPNVAMVYAEMREIHPNLGEIVQGVFSGGVRDIQATLQDYSNKLTAERERAVKTLQDQGVEVSLNDWIFPNWQPSEDFSPEDYQ